MRVERTSASYTSKLAVSPSSFTGSLGQSATSIHMSSGFCCPRRSMKNPPRAPQLKLVLRLVVLEDECCRTHGLIQICVVSHIRGSPLLEPLPRLVVAPLEAK